MILSQSGMLLHIVIVIGRQKSDFSSRFKL